MRKTRSFHSSRFEQLTLTMELKVGNLRLARFLRLPVRAQQADQTSRKPRTGIWDTLGLNTLSSSHKKSRIVSIPLHQEETPDFSPTLGGPLYEMLQRAYLAGPSLELQKRRVLVIILIAWLPLLFLSAFTSHLYGGQGLPFLRDIETHVRFLVALPVLVIAELGVHQKIPPALKLFLERGVVTAEDAPKFHAAIKTAMKVRDSVLLELAILAFAYPVGHWVWAHKLALETATWYAVPDGNSMHLTLPGYWNAFVSIPMGQFMLFWWYRGLAIWFWLLWRVSKLNLRLSPMHPDRAGGIGFLGETSYAFAPILFAQSAVLAGVILGRIYYEGQSLAAFEATIVVLIVYLVLLILGPLTVFTPRLARARRRGLGQYGTLATSYVTDFHDKWVRGGGEGEAILGTTDIQSLADLSNSYAIVREMRIVPFGFSHVARLAIIAGMPMLPLLLTIMPLHELVERLIKVIFF
jgi:hypothetical protein